jgi:glycerol kinase
VFIAGAAVQWLRDGLGLVANSAEIERLAAQAMPAAGSRDPANGGVYFVPAFVGLGAPYWDPQARGTIVGLTRGSTAAHLARATLEAMAYQTRDVLEAMQRDSGVALRSLRVDGGASANQLLLQFQADILGLSVQRPRVQETTALGAAYLAGLAVGFWQSRDDIAAHWGLDAAFEPHMPPAEREQLYTDWQRAVERARGWALPRAEAS